MCLELKGCETKLLNSSCAVNENFILCKSDLKKCKKLTYFGMEVNMNDSDSLNNLFVDDDSDEINCNIKESLHKSVIYVDPKSLSNTSELSKNVQNSEILNKEILDEHMSLYKAEGSTVINIIFKDTFSYACQIINELMMCEIFWIDDDEDNFPLGMEAEYLTRSELRNKWYLKYIIIK